MLRGAFFSILTLILLSACAPAARGPNDSVFPSQVGTTTDTGMTDASTAPVTAGTLREPVRVAILAPKTGPNAQLGEALLQAAQLAVFDLNEQNFQLIPKDTGGTAEGARRATDEAAREGARLILGPLFAPEVEAAKSAARTYGLTVIGFSTDWRLAGENAFTMGVLPFGQAQRMAEYAAKSGLRNIAIITTRDIYGDAVLSAFQTTAQRNGLNVQTVTRINADGNDAAKAVEMIIATGQTYDGIFLPIGGAALGKVTSALKGYGLTSARVKYLGTGLWDDASVTSSPDMAGALYAAPSPQVRTAFERNYQRIYGTTPPRLASIGYDAAALAIVLARSASAKGQRVTFDRTGITDPNGFSGVDGIFRFRSDGLAERGMAVLQIQNGGQIAIADQAPSSFAGR